MTRSEIWKTVDGASNYEVSNKGLVRFTASRRLRVQYDVNGYRRVYIGFLVYVHHLVAEAFIGPRDDREINHKNGIKSDNRDLNLEWVSHKANQVHGVQSGLFHSSFTEDEVRRVRARKWAYGEKAAYCREHGLAHGTLYNVLTYRVWAHIK